MSGGAHADAGEGRRGRPGLRGSLGSSLVATLSRPAAWPLALAAFLLRGGIVVFALPFIVLPTPTGLGTIVGPIIVRLAVGQPDARALGAVGALVGALGAWLILGGLVAAACEATIVRWAARDLASWDGGPAPADEAASGTGSSPASESSPARRWIAARVLLVRALAHIPFALALLWLVPALVAAVYAELVSPSDVAAPLAWRVLPHVLAPLALTGLAWVVGQVASSLGVRALVLEGRPVLAALAAGVRSALRHPLASIVTWGVGAVALALLVAPALLAAAFAWDQVRRLLPAEPATSVALGSVLLLVATWACGLFLAAIGAAWRATWWTAEWLRRPAPAGRPVAVGEPKPGVVRAAG